MTEKANKNKPDIKHIVILIAGNWAIQDIFT